MSRRACPYDSAYVESFIKTIKHEEIDREEIDREDYQSFEEARASIGCFLDVRYNTERLHSALGYLPPAEFEALHESTRLTP